MSALTTLAGPAAAMLQADINTDTIAPLVRGQAGPQPAGIRSDEELARRLFGPWRYRPDGSPEPDFVLNRPPFDQARFLVAGPNFACGSSRETAATMLRAFGIRCVIAPSFGLIFHDNCFRNHMLPLALDWQVVRELGALAERGADFHLDVAAGTLTPEGGSPVHFSLPAFRRDLLLQGADEVQLTLARSDAISAWQERARSERPWEWTAPRPS
jgi:3-isopropylmalate/(R)-2-methylmalate dehydratase small subunit